jgi:hypothetical protein
MKPPTVNSEYSKKRSPAMRKILCSVVVMILVGLVQVAVAATVATIGFSPTGPRTVASGSPYSWDVFVTIADSAPNQIVAAYSLDIRYDMGILTPALIEFSSKLGFASSFEVLQDYSLAKSGVVNIAAVSLLPDADLQALQGIGTGTRTVTLATLTFNAIASSTGTSLEADWSTHTGLRDVKGLNNMIISDSSVVPEPSTYLLTVIAGAAVAIATRMRRNKSA